MLQIQLEPNTQTNTSVVPESTLCTTTPKTLQSRGCQSHKNHSSILRLTLLLRSQMMLRTAQLFRHTLCLSR